MDYKQEKWVDLLPEHPDNVLDWACAVDGDKFVACYIEHVKVWTFKYRNNIIIYKLKIELKY